MGQLFTPYESAVNLNWLIWNFQPINLNHMFLSIIKFKLFQFEHSSGLTTRAFHQLRLTSAIFENLFQIFLFFLLLELF